MKFIIETRKSKDEILQIIQKNTSEHKGILFGNNGEVFYGKIFEYSFKIQRNINYKNSFLPVIIGNIDETGSATKVTIKMRLTLFAKGFTSFWFAFVIIYCIMMPFIQFDMPFFLIPYIMLAFGILFVASLCKYETKKAKEILEKLLKQ